MNVQPINLPPGGMEALLGALDVVAGVAGTPPAGVALDQRSLLRGGLVQAGAAAAAAVETTAHREAVLSTLNSGRAMRPHDLILTSPALLGLMRLAASPDCRMQRTDLAGQSANGGLWKMNNDDLELLLSLGYVEARGRWIEATDAGNALVRALLEFARGWEGGAA